MFENCPVRQERPACTKTMEVHQQGNLEGILQLIQWKFFLLSRRASFHFVWYWRSVLIPEHDRALGLLPVGICLQDIYGSAWKSGLLLRSQTCFRSLCFSYWVIGIWYEATCLLSAFGPLLSDGLLWSYSSFPYRPLPLISAHSFSLSSPSLCFNGQF